MEATRPTEGTRPWLLVVGAASRDIDADDPRGWRLGGSVAYCSLAAARLGMEVRALVGADAVAAGAHELEVLRDAGVEIQLVPLDAGPVFENRHVGAERLQIAHQASAAIRPSALPASWRAAPAVLLGGVAGELGEDWAAVPSHRALVAFAWQGSVRRIEPGRVVSALPMRANALSARADLAVVSAEDAAAGGDPLADLLQRAGQELAVTSGPLGALHIARSGDAVVPFRIRRVPAVPTNAADDPTGAGDVFLAAWTAARVAAGRHGAPSEDWRRLAVAAAAASLAVDSSTLAELPDLAAICRRLLTPPGGTDRPG